MDSLISIVKHISIFFIMAAIALELIMRVTGILLLAPSDARNAVMPEDASSIRILAIGESTTADYFAGDGNMAWPRQLEKKLRQKGIRARVYNQGIGANISPMILARLPEYLELYKPQIVISMMGINDNHNNNIIYDGTYKSKLILEFARLRIVRLYEWFVDSIGNQFRCKIIGNRDALPKIYDAIKLAYQLALSQSLATVESRLREEMPDANDSDISTALREIGKMLVGDEDPRRNYQMAVPYFDRAFDLDPYQYDNATSELIRMDSSRCKEVSEKILSCGIIPDQTLAQIILKCLEAYPDLATNSKFYSRGIILSSYPLSDSTSYHYRAMHKLLQQKHILHIAMQYPTLTLGALKSYFQDSKGNIDAQFADTIFVANQQNFAETLKHKRYEEIFTDRFRGSWGHTTERGHALIAESVSGVIEDLLRSHSFQ